MEDIRRESLLKRRQDAVGVLRRNGNVSIVQVYLSFIFGGVGNFVALCIFAARDQMAEFYLCAASMIVFIASCVMFARRWIARNKLLTDDSQITQAPEPISRDVGALIAPVAARMNLDLSRLTLYIGRKMFTAIPSIVESGERLHLIMPLGFLKVIRKNPDIARAMLAHELGHADQQDTKLWSLANIYWSVATRTLIPYAAFILFVQLLGSAPAVITAWREEIRAEQVEKFALEENDLLQEFESYKGPHGESLDTSLIVLELGMQDMEEFYIRDDADRARSLVGNALIGALLEAFPVGLQVGLIVLMLFSIRRLRRLSEEMADLAVVIYDDGYALQHALQLFGVPSRRWRPFAVHPTTQWRLRRIEEELCSA